jgi:hypothetical protein
MTESPADLPSGSAATISPGSSKQFRDFLISRFRDFTESPRAFWQPRQVTIHSLPVWCGEGDFPIAKSRNQEIAKHKVTKRTCRNISAAKPFNPLDS